MEYDVYCVAYLICSVCSELLSCLQNFNLRIFPSLCLAMPFHFLGFSSSLKARLPSEALLRNNLTNSKVRETLQA